MVSLLTIDRVNIVLKNNDVFPQFKKNALSLELNEINLDNLGLIGRNIILRMYGLRLGHSLP